MAHELVCRMVADVCPVIRPGDHLYVSPTDLTAYAIRRVPLVGAALIEAVVHRLRTGDLLPISHDYYEMIHRLGVVHPPPPPPPPGPGRVIARLSGPHRRPGGASRG